MRGSGHLGAGGIAALVAVRIAVAVVEAVRIRPVQPALGTEAVAVGVEHSPLQLEAVGNGLALQAVGTAAAAVGVVRIRPAQVLDREPHQRPHLRCHRPSGWVYAAVASLMGRGVHALSISARTPEEISH